MDTALSFSLRELALLRTYYDPTSPGYDNGVRSAALAGFKGSPATLAPQASRTLRKARQCGMVSSVLEKYECTFEHIAQCLSRCLRAQRKRALLSKDGAIVYADLGDDHQVQLTAARLLLQLQGAFDSKRQQEVLLAEVADAMGLAEQGQTADQTVDTALDSAGPATPENCERDSVSKVHESSERPDDDDTGGCAEVTGTAPPKCSAQSPEQALSPMIEEEQLVQAKETRAMIRRANYAIQQQLEPSSLTTLPASDCVELVQAWTMLIRESNEADRIDLERQKLVNTTPAFENWGAPTIDGVLVSDIRKEVNNPPGTAVAGPPAETAAGPAAKPASAEKAQSDADLPGPKAVPSEIVEAIREIDKMTPAERRLAKSIFLGVQNIARLELKAVAEDEATVQAETEPKPPKGGDS